jgi:hypothetical protein
MSRYVIYPAIAPLVFGLAYTIYHWKKVTLELVGWNFISCYVLFAVPSLIVAAIDSRGLKRRSDNRIVPCVATMLLLTVVPLAVMLPAARFEASFLLATAIAALIATGICYKISETAQPALAEGPAETEG